MFQILLVALSVAAVADAEALADEAFWDRGLTETLARGRQDSLWVLAFFPSPKDDEDPAQIRDFSLPKKLSPEVIGGRIRSQEIERFRSLFRPDHLPALVLLNPFGDFVHRWEELWQPRDVSRLLQSYQRRFRKLQEQLDRLLEEANAALKAERTSESIRLLRDLVKRSSESSPHRSRAQELLHGIGEDAEREFLKTMAMDGIRTDSELLKELKKLEVRYPLPGFRKKLEEEERRIRDRKIGGRG